LFSSCILTCDISVVSKEEALKEEQAVALKAERDTILAGMQNVGSMAAFSMTGQMQPQASKCDSFDDSSMSHLVAFLQGRGSNGEIKKACV